MKGYDHIRSKERVLEILGRPKEEIISENVPSDRYFKFGEAYNCQITCVFVNIQNSEELYGQKITAVTKIMRSYSSEIIDILRQSDNARDIGVIGDRIYGVYATPENKDVRESVLTAAYVNTFVKMLNVLSEEKGTGHIRTGIGVSTSLCTAIKAAGDRSGMNGKLWIGEAVKGASDLSLYGSKEEYTRNPIVISETAYEKMIESYAEEKREDVKRSFTPQTFGERSAYTANITIVKIDDWIKNGMK